MWPNISLKLRHIQNSCLFPNIILRFEIRKCLLCNSAQESDKYTGTRGKVYIYTGEPSFLHAKGLLNTISDELLHKLEIDMNLKYVSAAIESGHWVTVLSSEWPTQLRTVGVALRKKKSQHQAAEKLLRTLVENNIVSRNDELLSSIPSSFSESTCHLLQNQHLELHNEDNLEVNHSNSVRTAKLQNQNFEIHCEDDLEVNHASSVRAPKLSREAILSLTEIVKRNKIHNDNLSVAFNDADSSARSITNAEDVQHYENYSMALMSKAVNYTENSFVSSNSNNKHFDKLSVNVEWCQGFLGQMKSVRNVFGNIEIRSLHNSSKPDLAENAKTDVKLSKKIPDSSVKLQNLEVPVTLPKTPRKSSSATKKKQILSNEESKIPNVPVSSEPIDVEQGDLDIVERKFPQPKGTLHNLCAVVARELKNSTYNLDKSYRMVQVRTGKSSSKMWNCTYKIKWPIEASFSATMPSKAAAGKQTALKALHWLQTQGKLTKTGSPLMFDKSEIREISRVPPEIKIDAELHSDIDTLINWYKKDIEPVLSEWDMSEDQKEMLQKDEDMKEELFGTEEVTNPITGLSKRDIDAQTMSRRSTQLYNRYVQRTKSANLKLVRESRENLPIAELKEQIIQMVEENPAVVIKGEPGCGKSTQVPQYLMEHFEALKQGAHCNIIITQPRRISAIALAEWVAHERKERVGDVVGYQVRLKAVFPQPPGGALLFCSTGILLRRLQSNPGLVGASHVILDEAHERDINTDLLLVLLRRALSLNPHLRVIVMSATINAELFQKYFDDAPVLHVQGFTYPVKSFFLDNLNIQGLKMESKLSSIPFIDCEQVAKVIRWVDHNRPEGAILCFLPGWAEIVNVTKHLGYINSDSHLVLPVHSRLGHDEQRRIFSRPPPGVRKIILATNIAETSITIDDVVYVIETGTHKEQRLDVHLGVASLGNQWVSQANVNQRRGRAGRVQPGECFHLYTRKMYDSLDQYPIPELLRVPLEKTVLDLKTYNQEQKAAEFLSEMPEPPSPEAVSQAVGELIQLGALDENEKLTPLGRRIALFTTHPKLSKALVHAAIFRCVNPMITIATVLSSDAELFRGGLDDKESIREVKKCYHPSSDHVALAWLYQEWETIFEESKRDAHNFCFGKGLINNNMDLTCKLRKLFAEHLWQCRMLNDSEDFKNLDAACNKYSGNDEMVKAVFLSGTGTLLFRRNWDVKNGRLKKNANVVLTEGGQRTTITSDSVNFGRSDFPSPYLTYFRQVQSQERRTIILRETSLISLLSALLFSTGQLTVHKYTPPPSSEGKWNNHVLMKINRRRDLLMLCDSSHVQRLVEIRVILWNLINYFVTKEGIDEDQERYQTILGYHERFLEILCRMMHRAGAAVEYTESGTLRN